MTNKYLLFTDFHLGMQNHNKFWEDVAFEFIDEIIKTCKERNINKIICSGDFFDSRKNLNVLTIESALNIVKKIEEEYIDFYIIRGNHDTFYKNAWNPHSLTLFNNCKNIHIISKDVKELDGMYLVPWEANMEEIPDNAFVIGHFEINGFVTNASGTAMKSAKLSPKDFKRFNRVLSGHFHTPSTQNNIQYIGSPFQMNFNDAGSQRGYYILENYELEFIPFEKAPKFIKLTSEDEFVNVEGNIIQLTFVKDYGSVENENILQKLNDMKPANIHVKYNIAEEDDNVIDEGEDFNVSNNPVIFRDYVKETVVPENINKDILIKFIEKLEQED